MKIVDNAVVISAANLGMFKAIGDHPPSVPTSNPARQEMRDEQALPLDQDRAIGASPSQRITVPQSSALAAPAFASASSGSRTLAQRSVPVQEFDPEKAWKTMQDGNVAAVQPSNDRAKALDTFFITCIERAGNPKEIKIPIGVCTSLCGPGLDPISDAHLGLFFQLVNTCTINTPYAIDESRLACFEHATVPRPNHNGTHSARQARYVEALFDLVESKGSADAKRQLAGYTAEERQNIKLAAYFLRAGRVDESGFGTPPPDNYYERSAQIYEAYAKQLSITPETLAWTRNLVANSGNAFMGSTGNAKHNFAMALLLTAHEMDLQRCYPKGKMDEVMANSQSRLVSVLECCDDEARALVTTKLYNYAQTLCKTNGTRVRMLEIEKYTDEQAFVQHSNDGAECWAALQSKPFPIW